MTTPSDNDKWLGQAVERGIKSTFLQNVDLTDRAHKAALYQKFDISGDVEQQVELLAFLRTYQQQAKSTLPSSPFRFFLDTSIIPNNNKKPPLVVTFDSMPTYQELCTKLGMGGEDAYMLETMHVYCYSKTDQKWSMLTNAVMPVEEHGPEFDLRLANKTPASSPVTGVRHVGELPDEERKSIVRGLFKAVEAEIEFPVKLKIEEWQQTRFEGDVVKPDVMASSENENAPDLNLHQLENALSSLTNKLVELINSDVSYNLALIGVSGCGKTRTIHEVLTKEFGLYFVCNTFGNRGSSDMSAALQKIRTSATKVGRDINDDVKERTLEARKIMHRLASGRLHIFQRVQKLLKKKNKSLTPRNWLLMQLFPYRWFGQDIFRDLYLSDQDIPETYYQDGEYPQAVFIDEAQICDKKEEYGLFLPAKTLVGANDKERRSVLSPFIVELGSFGFMDVIIAGTGLGLRSAMETTRSAVAALTAAGRENNFEVLTDFDRTETTAHVKSFLERIISESVLNAIPLDSILQVVRERKRFLAALAQLLVLNKGHWEQTRKDFLSVMMNKNTDESIAHHVYKVLYSEMACSFCAVAVGSSMMAERPVLAVEDYELINAGVCFLSKNEKKEFIGTIDEPLVLSVLWTYHSELVWGKTLDVIALDPRLQDASSLGFFAEAYIIPFVRKYASKFDFAKVRGVPEWIKEGVPFKGEMPTIVSHNDGSINFATYLRMKPNNTTFRPDVFNHADFAESFCAKNSTKKRLCTGQVKLWKSDASFGEEFEEAINSTRVDNMYTTKAGGDICAKLKQQVKTSIDQEYEEGILRIVVTHPGPPGPSCKVEGKDVILFIDLTDIIPTKDKRILDTLKTALKSCSCSQSGGNCATKRCGCKWREEKCNSGCHHENLKCCNTPSLDEKKRKLAL